MIALALTRIDIANYLSALFEVYILLILLYILLNLMFSFGVRIPYSRWSDAILGFLRDVCEPYLRLFRRLCLRPIRCVTPSTKFSFETLTQRASRFSAFVMACRA